MYFINYLALKFEFIVMLLKENKPLNSDKEKTTKWKLRLGFELGENYLLRKYGYKGFLRLKFCTLILGEPLIPKFPKIIFALFQMMKN